MATLTMMGFQTKKENLIHQVPNTNPSNTPAFVFHEDLSISREGWDPLGMAIDENGNIYAVGESDTTMYVFNPQGKEIDKAIFRNGQGPGDFGFMAPVLSSKNELYVFDKANQRLTILDKKWKILKTINMNIDKRDRMLYFDLNSRDDLIYWKSETKRIDNNTERTVSLKQYSMQNNKADIYYEYSTTPLMINDSAVITYFLYPRYGIFKMDGKDNIYYAVSDSYRIDVISPQGRHIRSIDKKSKPRKISNKDTENEMLSVTKQLRTKPKFVIPDLMPALADFFILENDYLLAITYENSIDSLKLKGDLFDDKGNYISSIEVPKYFLWDSCQNLFKKCAIYKKGFFYTIMEDKEGGFALKRYRLDWK